MTQLPCTNPNCQATIKVSPEESVTTCPACGTWHFLEPQNAQTPPPEETPDADEAYYTPAASPETNEQPSSNIPIFQPYDLDTGKTEHTVSKTVAENVRLGYLITEEGKRFPLQEGRNTIGRKDCDIIIEDQTVSRRHCIIEAERIPSTAGWMYAVYDIGHAEANASANGVFVSGRTQRLRNHERIPIGQGTIIQLGNIRLKLDC